MMPLMVAVAAVAALKALVRAEAAVEEAEVVVQVAGLPAQVLAAVQLVARASTRFERCGARVRRRVFSI